MEKPAEEMSSIVEPDPEIIRHSSRKVMIQLTSPLLFILFLIILFAAYLDYVKDYSILQPLPLILTIIGVVIAFFGAFYDFGAKRYLSDISRQKMEVTDKDIVYINRQQLILTLLFFGIGGLYVLGAFAVYLFL